MMISDHLQTLTTWQVIQAGENAVRIASPFTYGDDGACITFSIFQPSPNSFFLSDDGASIMQAAIFGTEMDKKKLLSLNQTAGVHYAQFAENGEIQASGSWQVLQFALFDAAKLALALSFRLPKWLPKFNQMRFRNLVESTLRRDIPAQNIVKDYKTTGISGHQLVFPFALTTPERNVLIEPIALKDGKIDWASVYQAHGKFSDLKRLDTHNKRLAILEGDETSEYGAAATVLGDSCHVRTLNTTESWQLQRIIH